MTEPARPLTLDDISDQRAYERERDEFRRRVIAVKKLRRVTVGPVVTLVFESRSTVRFQVQEMARAERMRTDRQIQHELDIYNRLLPGPGELSATLFLELVSEEELRTWLSRLIGVEWACQVRFGTGGSMEAIASTPEEDHLSHLTRPATTSAVHYVRFRFDQDQIDAFVTGPTSLAVDHPAYPDGMPGTVLGEATRVELAKDLAGA